MSRCDDNVNFCGDLASECDVIRTINTKELIFIRYVEDVPKKPLIWLDIPLVSAIVLKWQIV